MLKLPLKLLWTTGEGVRLELSGGYRVCRGRSAVAFDFVQLRL